MSVSPCSGARAVRLTSSQAGSVRAGEDDEFHRAGLAGGQRQGPGGGGDLGAAATLYAKADRQGRIAVVGDLEDGRVGLGGDGNGRQVQDVNLELEYRQDPHQQDGTADRRPGYPD